MKKRILCLLLSAVLLVTVLPFSAFAKEETCPVVIDSGYMTSQIFLFDDEGNIEKRIWDLDILSILKQLVRQTPGLLEGAAEYMESRSMETLTKEFSLSVYNILEPMRREANGTPAYNTGVWPTSAKESNMQYIYDNMDKIEYLEGTIHEEAYIDRLCGQVGAENVFQFCVDWRQEIIYCARDLGEYINDVLSYTGAKKVNILSESHGGQTAGTYIALCSLVEKGGEAARELASLLDMTEQELKECFNLDNINNAVLNSPAIGGVQIAYDFLSCSVHLDLPTIIELVQGMNPYFFIAGTEGYVSESDLEWLLFFAKFDRINELVNLCLASENLSSTLISFGSLWDFVDVEHYDEIRQKYITDEEKAAAYAPMLKNTDFAHYTVMPQLDTLLSYARDNGVNVSIICGTGVATATGSSAAGDSIIAAKTASGAKVTDYGYRFANGYTTDLTDSQVNCTDKTHNHVSPGMDLDASYAYLPDNTWFIEGQYHAQYAFDEYAASLTDKLLLTDELENVYSDPTYPQFETTYNAKYGVHAQFDASSYGFVSSRDTTLVIENISAKSGLELVAIEVEGADVQFDSVAGKKIALGEKLSVPLSVPITDGGKTNFTVTVYYLKDNAVFSIGMRRFNFTVNGEENVAFDASSPIVAANVKPVYITADDVKSALSNFGAAVLAKALVLTFRRTLNLARLSFLEELK